MSQLIIISILIWLAIIGLSVFLIAPLSQECLSRVNVNTQKEAELAELEQLVTKVETLKQDYFAHLDLAEKAQNALPSQEEIPELISEATSLASKNALLITNLSFSIGGQVSQASFTGTAANTASDMANPIMAESGSIANPESPGTSPGSLTPRLVSISLSLKGSYDDFKSFLRDAERDLRILDLRNLTLSPGQETEQSSGFGTGGVNSFDIEFETYFLPQQK